MSTLSGDIFDIHQYGSHRADTQRGVFAGNLFAPAMGDEKEVLNRAYTEGTPAQRLAAKEAAARMATQQTSQAITSSAPQTPAQPETPSADNPSTPPDTSSDFPWVPVIAAGVGGLALIGIVVAVVASSKKAGTAVTSNRRRSRRSR